MLASLASVRRTEEAVLSVQYNPTSAASVRWIEEAVLWVRYNPISPNQKRHFLLNKIREMGLLSRGNPKRTVKDPLNPL